MAIETPLCDTDNSAGRSLFDLLELKLMCIIVCTTTTVPHGLRLLRPHLYTYTRNRKGETVGMRIAICGMHHGGSRGTKKEVIGGHVA